MPGTQPGSVLGFLRRLARRASAEQTDGQLLERFTSVRDGAAFEALVARHGALVWGLCRKLLPGPQDAEDAFQATFLVLARRAACVRKRESVASFLYGVAYRVAARARAEAIRRRARERQGAPICVAQPGPDHAGAERALALHEEVQRLPARYRAPVVLCYLEGKTHEEAARQLAWPVGSVKGRLARARDLLRRRLVRRGLAGPAGTALLLAQSRMAEAAPTALLRAAAQAGLLPPTAESVGGALSANGVHLAEGVVRAMQVTKWKVLSAALLTAGLAAGAGVFGSRGFAPERAPVRTGVARAAARAPGPTLAVAVRERASLGGFPDYVAALAFAADGKTLAGVSQSNDEEKVAGGLRVVRPGCRVRLWYLAPARERPSVKLAGLGAPAALTPDLQRIAIRDDNTTVRLVAVATAKDLARIAGHADVVRCLAFSPDGKRLATGDEAGVVKVWDPAGRELHTLKGHTEPVRCLAFSPDGKTLASGSRDLLALTWDVRTGRRKAALAGHTNDVSAVAFSPDGRVLATGSFDQTVRLWDTASGKERATLRGHKKGIFCLAFGPRGRLLASASEDGTVRLWDTTARRELASLTRHAGPVWCVAFAPDGQTLATGGQDRTVKLWEVRRR
jgi:RNA polymerase sigma factor (sigma-70 family)